LWRDEFFSGEVVIKPPRSGGCDGVAVCGDIVSLSKHIQQQLLAINLEKIRNTELIIQEYLMVDCEYVVNTVSVRGRHFITDVWRSSPKRQSGFFLYDTQELVTDLGSVRDVIEYAKAVLTAVEVQHGACHIEIGSVESAESDRALTLIEVNARLAGEIRTSNAIPGWYGFDQVYWFLKSILNPEEFDVEPDLSELYSNDNPTVIVVFLQNLHHASCCLSNEGIESIRKLGSFFKFGRGLAYANERGTEISSRRIGRTVDLVSSPGVVMLVGPAAKDDVIRVRNIEKRYLYINHAMTT
jgi:biotin carboxylase